MSHGGDSSYLVNGAAESERTRREGAASGGDGDPHTILRQVFGFDDFRGQQEQVVRHVIAGGDALVIMPTGGGKSLCYQLPALLRPGVAVVVSPLIALMQDQVGALRQLGLRAAFINSTLTFGGARELEQEMVRGGIDLVYVAPERLTQPRFLELLDQTPLALFAIDEAHCVSQWGHDFRPEYRQLTILHQRYPDVPRIALTATADEPTRRDIAERLQLESARRFISSFDRPNITYRVVVRDNPRRQLLRFIRNEHAGDAGIVYCLSRKRTEHIAAWLNTQGITAVPYHAGLDAGTRQANQRRFIEEEGVVVVATIAFGMGIDKPDVRFVAHLDLPRSIEAYYQETGRAGRDGLPADAWMCYGAGDVIIHQQFIDNSEAPEQQKWIERNKLSALLGYCETTLCRRQVLLRYFGEAYDGPCGACDTCIMPIERFDGTELAQKAMSCIYRTGQCYGSAYIADVLTGARNERIIRARHDQLSTHGIGRDLPRKKWLSILRQLLAAGLIAVDPAHGGMRLTERARPVLRGDQPIWLRADPSMPVSGKAGGGPKAAKADSGGAAGAAAPSVASALTGEKQKDLFDRLRALRLELARQQNVPPYVIFADRTLLEMAATQPRTAGQLAELHGVGQTKLERYGEVFLDAIAEEVG